MKNNNIFKATPFIIIVLASAFLYQRSHAENTQIENRIDSFWGIAESKFQVESTRTEATRPHHSSAYNRPQSEVKIKQKQSVDDKNHHFGLEILGSLSLFEFQWGTDNKSENHAIEGTLRD